MSTKIKVKCNCHTENKPVEVIRFYNNPNQISMQVCHECGYDNERGDGQLSNCLNCGNSFETEKSLSLKVKCKCC